MVKSPNYTQIAPVKGRPTIFGNVFEKNIAFLIDTSGSMYHSLEVVKEHLIEILSSRATSGRDTMFNIISFDKNVTTWANRMVPCTPRTVSSAAQWIQTLRPGTSTNTMDALLEAYGDDGMDAIYLVTDGLPDQLPAVILENVHLLHNGRPIHATYLTGTHSDQAAVEFLESIARETKGSLHVISLTMLGNIQKVTPVFNETSESIRNYIGDPLWPTSSASYSLQKPSVDARNYINLERPLSAPPASGLVPRIYNPLNDVSILSAPHGSIPIPYVSRYIYDKHRGHSQVLDYADSVLASRGLAEFVDKSVSSVPVAASIMKGIKVLGRRDSDGLYYMATVKGQIQNEKFILDFHKCPAIAKPFVQETAIFECIAVKDSIRHHVCIGDKVLAPWQPDGRYGPGTVIDGVDRRDPQPPGFEQGGSLLVTFYNGETTEVGPGTAIRIPLTTFDRLVTELQMPEHQRRQMRLAAKTKTPEYNGMSPPPKDSTWMRSFSPPKTAKNENNEDGDAVLKARIAEQLRRNRHLLKDLSVKQRVQDALKSQELETSRKEVHFDEIETDSFDNEEEDQLKSSQIFETVDVDAQTQTDFRKYVGRSVPIGTPLSKAGGKPEHKKRWRTWSSGVPPRPARFRDTVMSKPAEAKQDKPVRPAHQEYQSADGVPFPSGTDKKFANERWHPHYGHAQRQPVTSSGDPKLKHHEYRSSTGVPFPAAADRKFNAVPSSNWSPDQAGRSTCWEDGLGLGDTKKVMKDRVKMERKRHVAEQYEQRIHKDAIAKETRESERQQNHRNQVNKRNEQIADDIKNKQQHASERQKYKREMSQKIRDSDVTREEKAQTWKVDRIDAMKTRRAQHENMEQSFERAAQEQSKQKQDGLKQREQQRYETHHNKLVSERTSEEARERRLKEQEINRQNKLDKIKATADRSKEMRLHIKRQNHDKYRASIIP